MRRNIHAPETVQATIKFDKITLKDAFYVIASIGVGFMTKSFVYPWLSYVYIAAFPVVSYVLLLPSKDSPQKKNVQTILTVIFKDRGVYKALEKPAHTPQEEREENDGI